MIDAAISNGHVVFRFSKGEYIEGGVLLLHHWMILTNKERPPRLGVVLEHSDHGLALP